MIRLLSIVFALSIGSSSSFAQYSVLPVSFSGETITVSDTDIDIKKALLSVDIDGVKSPGEWEDAVRLSLDYETEPGNNIPASSTTYFFLKYDEDNLYFAFQAFDDNPDEIRAFISDRDNVRNNDRVGVYIDPFNTNASAYDFTVNALGIQEDGIIFGSGGGYDRSWDALWDASGKINDEGFFVEARIPLKSIRYRSTQETQTWSISAWRKIPRSEEVETRTHPIEQDINCTLCQFNRVDGFENLSTNRNVEILPTYVGNKTDIRENITDENMDAGRINTSFGVDARIGITNNLILNSTINPDFSQIEADAAQLNINNRFALRFREQRPFFQEGAEIYRTPEEIVFTRTIADPVFGNKLTGKFGRSEAGLLVAQDEINNLLFPSNDGSDNTTLNDRTTSVLGRYKFTVNEALAFGYTSTSRFGDQYSNFVNSLDAYFRPLDPLSVQVQYINSLTEYPAEVATAFDQSEDQFSGNALFIAGEYDTRNWQGTLAYVNRDPKLRTDAGFIPQVDLRGFEFSAQRKIWSEGQSWFTRFFITAGGNVYEDFNNRKLSSGLFGAVSYLGPLQSRIEARFFPVRESRYQLNLYTLGPRYNLNMRIQPSGKIETGLTLDAQEQIDFVNEDIGDQYRLIQRTSLRLGMRTEVELDYNYTVFNRDGDFLFKANIFESNIQYNFTQRFFIRSILQYRFTKRNPELYTVDVRPEQQTLFTQWLISYQLNAQSVLFLGYSDDYLGYEDELQNRIDLIQTDRTFFFKVGYVWRL